MKIHALLIIGAIGCTTESENPFAVRETSSSLQIVHREDGVELGRLDLSQGRFTMSEDGRVVTGRKMTINVGGHEITHESEGFTNLTLPLPRGPELAEVRMFLLDPAVEPLLAARGIAFDYFSDIESPDEVPLWTGSNGLCGQGCGGCSFAAPNGFTTYSCGEWSVNNEYGQFRCGVMSNGQKSFTERRCSTPNGNTGCGPAGPNGCAPCWSTGWTYWCNIQTQSDGPCYSYCAYDFN